MFPVLLALIACGSPRGDSDSDSPIASGPPDPSTYDCRATAIPDRVNPVDPACAVDRTCTTRLVSGHRGMGGELGGIAPEDTVSGVKAAIAYGIDYVETDPRPSADGVLVNVHDTTTDRVTGVSGNVADMTLAELQALPILADRYPGDFSCERIATLSEILVTARGRVHVLVDANKTDRVDLLVGAIVDADALDWAIFDTSGVDKIDAALAIEPRLHTMIRTDTKEALDSQLAHFADHPPDIVEIDKFGLELAPDVVAAGNRPLVDAFLADSTASYNGDLSGYQALYDEGLVILQGERADLIVGIAH